MDSSFFSFGAIVWGREKIRSDLKGPLLEKILAISIICFVVVLLVYGIFNITKAVMHIDFPSDVSRILIFTAFIFGGFTFTMLTIINKKKFGSISGPNHKEGTTEKIANIGMIFLLAVVVFSMIMGFEDTKIDCDNSCKTKFENLGFLCKPEETNQYSCRFVADKAITISIPPDASSLPNEKNFQPEEVTIILEVNNVIRWINLDKSTHKIISNDKKFSSKELDINESFIYRFTEDGIYDYHSDVPWLKGKIIVKNLDNEYQSGIPLKQITNKQDVFYNIYRESDHFGYITNSSILSSESMLISMTNQTEPKFIKIGDSVIENCFKNGENRTVSYLTLTEIKELSVPYAIFKEINKNELNGCN